MKVRRGLEAERRSRIQACNERAWRRRGRVPLETADIKRTTRRALISEESIFVCARVRNKFGYRAPGLLASKHGFGVEWAS